MNNIRTPWEGWRIAGEIGSGSFGTVYEIERNLYNSNEKAAMKVIHIPRDENEREMLLLSSGYDEAAAAESIDRELDRVEQEYSVMSSLKGISNIVSCEDFAYEKNADGLGYTVYIRMELLKSLHKLIQERKKNNTYFPEAEVIKLGKDICSALSVCEKHNIIHRDIKPQNIMISSIGDYKLGDFGTAKEIDHTTQATFAGTLSYMAPEVLRREKYGKTVDIYSLGLVMYWLMNRYRMPFVPHEGLPTSDVIRMADDKRISGEALPAPCDAGKELSAVILKACAFRSEDRYRSADDMFAALRKVLVPERDSDATVVDSTVAETVIDEEATIGMFSGGSSGETETVTMRETFPDSGEKVTPEKDLEEEASEEEEKEKKKRKSHSKILIAVIIAAVVAAAGIIAVITTQDTSPAKETFESYAEDHPEAYKSISRGLNENTTVTVSKNSIIYSTDVSLLGIDAETAFSDDTLQKFADAISMQEETMASLCKVMEEESGISGIKAYVYYTYENQLICWGSYTADGLNAASSELNLD